MKKKSIWALILIGFAVIVLIMNAGGIRVEIDLLVTEIKAARSMVYLGFLAMGVVIGVLLQ